MYKDIYWTVFLVEDLRLFLCYFFATGISWVSVQELEQMDYIVGEMYIWIILQFLIVLVSIGSGTDRNCWNWNP